MKYRRLANSVVVIVASFALSQWASGQDFTNLDFESAAVVPIDGSAFVIEFSAAFPGWTGYTGTNVATEALYNEAYLDSSGISLYGDPGGPLGATLSAGYTSNEPLMSGDTTLLQTGLIPAGSQSLLFDGAFDGQSNAFAVTLNGQTLSLVPLSTDSNVTEYGASINAWAGQTATLAFTVFPQQPHTDDNYLTLTDIQFSGSPVPEPGVIALFAVSSLFFSLRRFVCSN